MAWRECIAAITEAAGRKLSNDEIEAIASAVQARIIKKTADGMSISEARGLAAKEVSGELTLNAMLKKREAFTNFKAWEDIRLRDVQGDELMAERTLMNGRQKKGLDNATSVSAEHHAIRNNIIGPTIVALEKANLLKAVRKGDPLFDRQVATELFRRDTPDASPGTGNAHAVQAAEILGGAMDAGRAAMNKAGAWVGKIENYAGRQFHDQMKIAKAGFESWRDFIKTKLDMDKSFPDVLPQDIDGRLEAQWKALATGQFEGNKEGLGGFVGPSNLAQKVSQNRSLIFKDGPSWVDYNDRFGKGKVMDAVWAGADRAARDAALMRTYGTNPQAMFDKNHTYLIEQAKNRHDTAMVQKLQGSFNKQLFDVVSGRADIPANQNLAYVFSTVRQMMQLKALGGVIFSAIPDVVNTSEVLRHNGVPLMRGLAGQLRAILPYGAAEKEIAHGMGAGIDGMVNSIVHRFRSEDGIPGKFSEAVNAYHKLNGLTYWTENQKIGMALGLTSNLAWHADKAFADLPKLMQTSMQRYGIEAAGWDAARATVETAADGRKHLLPAGIADPELSMSFKTMINDSIREGMNEPTAMARTILSGGVQSGTWGGEIIRSVAQFKSFTTTYMERHMGRVLLRDGFDVPGAIYLAAGLTLAGYVGMTLKDLAANRSPRAFDADHAGRLLVDSMATGGAFGMLGDYVLRPQYQTQGADVAKGAVGPAAASLFDLIAAVHATEQGSNVHSRASIAATQAAKLVIGNSPNLFYTSSAFNYLTHYMIQEKISPGAIQRQEKVMRDKGQHWLLSPH